MKLALETRGKRGCSVAECVDGRVVEVSIPQDDDRDRERVVPCFARSSRLHVVDRVGDDDHEHAEENGDARIEKLRPRGHGAIVRVVRQSRA